MVGEAWGGGGWSSQTLIHLSFFAAMDLMALMDHMTLRTRFSPAGFLPFPAHDPCGSAGLELGGILPTVKRIGIPDWDVPPETTEGRNLLSITLRVP